VVSAGSTAGVILCGGQSRRMGGSDKANRILAGKPMIQHVIDRMRPQVGKLVLSVEQYSDHYSEYGLEQVIDLVPGHAGPLGGLLSALKATAADQEWLLLAPCDAPFLPVDLGQQLKTAALNSGRQGCVVSCDGAIQPTFSIWNRSLLSTLEQAVLTKGMAGFKQFLDYSPQGLLDWERSDISPFFNINDSTSLADAERILNALSAKGCVLNIV
jgi:molybdopterin-guanine dinucleotide biosynthesis protein A